MYNTYLQVYNNSIYIVDNMYTACTRDCADTTTNLVTLKIQVSTHCKRGCGNFYTMIKAVTGLDTSHDTKEVYSNFL